MRTSILLSLIAIAALAGRNSSTSTSGSTQTPHTIIAKVNGKDWTSLANFGAYVFSGANSKISIVGIAADSSEFTIVMPNVPHGWTGTDSLGSIFGNYAMYSSHGEPDPSVSYVTVTGMDGSFSGSVTITSYDSTKYVVSGTFHFVARKANNPSDSVSVTSGSFYQVQFSA